MICLYISTKLNYNHLIFSELCRSSNMEEWMWTYEKRKKYRRLFERKSSDNFYLGCSSVSTAMYGDLSHTHTHTHYKHINKHENAQTRMHTHIHANIHKHTNIHKHENIQTCMPCTHTHTHTHTHVWALTCLHSVNSLEGGSRMLDLSSLAVHTYTHSTLPSE